MLQSNKHHQEQLTNRNLLSTDDLPGNWWGLLRERPMEVTVRLVLCESWTWLCMLQGAGRTVPRPGDTCTEAQLLWG